MSMPIKIITKFKTFILLLNLAIHYSLLLGTIWSIAVPKNRIWPPPNKKSWEFILSWILFYVVFILNGLLMIFNWNSWIFKESIRFLLGIPVAVVGSWLLVWGIFTLGKENTSGLKEGFILSGPYRFTRNPQYLGDILLFTGLVLISNSFFLFVFNSLLILIFLFAPISEEIWLVEQYGEKYIAYKKETPRFF
jgi:protein-S-isoprenylcysteine O-methyltransferase Ste14